MHGILLSLSLGIAVVAGGIIFAGIGWVERLTMTRRITVTTVAGEVTPCLNVTLYPTTRDYWQVMCATATKDGGFIFRGFDLYQVREVRAK